MPDDQNTPLDNPSTEVPTTPPVAPSVPPAPEPSTTVTSEPATEPQPAAAPAPAPASGLDSLFDQIAAKIIEQQEAIIGPIAVDQAKLVSELKINWPNKHEVDIEGSPQVAIDELVEQYKELFGQIAVETCREAVANLLNQLPADQQPSSLKA